MTTLATDDFNRANEDPLAGNWTSVQHNARLVSNQFAGPASDTDGLVYWSPVTPPDAQWSQITVKAAGSNNDWGPACRVATGAVTAYFQDHFPGSEGLYKAVGGTYTNIAAGSAVGYSVNDVLYVEAQGTNIACTINGSADASTSDVSISSGRLGLFVFNNDARGDDWSGGDFLSAFVPFSYPRSVSFQGFIAS